MKRSDLHRIIREVVQETIRKVGEKYVVYPEKGGKRLGTHSTRKAAEKQLTAIHLNREGKYDDTSGFDLVKKNPFDIEKLVDKGIVHISAPGDGKGGVARPNWEGDASIITLKNLNRPEPWMKKSIEVPMPKAIPHVQKSQDKLIYNGKYNQILWSIDKKGYSPEDFYLKESKNTTIKYSKPNFEFEWEEANRYPEFQELGKEGWIDIAKKGHTTHFSKIKDFLGNVDLNFDKLEKAKKERFNDAFEKGTVETPIAVKFSDKDYDLVAGNTRLSGLVNKGVDPKIWIVDLSSLSEDVHEPMNPGILKKRLGKLSCSKVRAERAKLKDKGTTYAKALQRYLNYHCQ